MIHQCPETDFCSKSRHPCIDGSAFVHPLAAVIGHVSLGRRVMVAPFASVRGDEGQPIHVDDDANIQDGVVLHALETESRGRPLRRNLVTIGDAAYAVYIGRRVSLAHQCQVHGPARVGDDSFVGMQSLLFRATLGERCVVEPGCILMGVTVNRERYVPSGTVITDQGKADALPLISETYPLKDLNKGVVHVNTRLAEAYRQLDLPEAHTSGPFV
jgi:carbonic anhydrase/acetyltransferase-like protein (isoleucine patch superfamily)